MQGLHHHLETMLIRLIWLTSVYCYTMGAKEDQDAHLTSEQAWNTIFMVLVTILRSFFFGITIVGTPKSASTCKPFSTNKEQVLFWLVHLKLNRTVPKNKLVQKTKIWFPAGTKKAGFRWP